MMSKLQSVTMQCQVIIGQLCSILQGDKNVTSSCLSCLKSINPAPVMPLALATDSSLRLTSGFMARKPPSSSPCTCQQHESRDSASGTSRLSRQGGPAGNVQTLTVL